ncbi:hypothetical protein SCLCIDRAFT_1220548 [Scleroderma citrinum Foug A]|uniref:Uncharacterized protein n=1 Tax=Scleroderma citrinum Foug A TaxID=1036808 RepID=A0A0C3D5U2_9AGAM|nr:hypothetical protein SCLCIDRAFT_1220548 [Scleroderma citrinum Foug A]
MNPTRFANAARIMDFSKKDIHLPDPERTRFILSAFINFVIFTEQCTSFVSSLHDKSATIIEEWERVAQELLTIQYKLTALKAQHAKDEPRCKELLTENAAITAHLMDTKETTQGVVKEIEAFKSPERIKHNITTMAAASIEDKKIIVQQEAKAHDLQANLSALSTIDKDFRACVEQLQTTDKEVQLLEASQKELANSHATATAATLNLPNIECNELQMKKERVHRQLANAQDKLECIQRHTKEKWHASQQTIKWLQHKYEQMDIERRENDKQVEEFRKEANEVEAKMTEHLTKSEAELNELLAEYWKLRHETEVYMERLANKQHEFRLIYALQC